LQGHALWKIFLLTTGSFFVLSLTDLTSMAPGTAPFGGRFPAPSPCFPAFLSPLDSALSFWLAEGSTQP